jgi:hypothetical protein
MYRMALLTISGDPASRWEEAANGAAHLLNFELITETRLHSWMAEEFGDSPVPHRAWKPAVISIVARMAAVHHLVIALPGAESLFTSLPILLRAGIIAPQARRIGNLMLDHHLERPAARAMLNELDSSAKQLRRARFSRPRAAPEAFDLILNAEHIDSGQISEILRAAVHARGLATDDSLLSTAAEAQIQFQTRLQLSKHGIVPAVRASIKPTQFGHPSEQLFANLLDFYRIRWDYEPRSFPLQWDKDGNVTEAFTPDFYLPEFDLYVELTTMKQALVTRKNRKVKLLRAIYPHVNIQVFYQKDFQDLVFKYGLKAS